MTRVAAIDCGTNSIRLLVADRADGRLTDLTREMRIVRLGEGVDWTGSLAPQAIERTRMALADYAATIQRLGADRVRMVATSATRDASNRRDFEQMVSQTLGTPAEVITGEEEARLSFAGATSVLAGEPPPVLVVDLGGGSTELVIGSATVDSAYSMDVGCVRLTERHLRADPPTAEQIAAARSDVRGALAEAQRTVDITAARTFVGVAGTVTTVVALALGLADYDPDRIHGARITADRVEEIATRLLAASHGERAALPAMHPGRVDVIGAGALVLAEVVRAAGVDTIVASEHDILDGMALALR